MRIGIISDTHDHKKRTAAAMSLLITEGAETLIHCGDLTGPEIVHECGRLPGYYVFGNNDFDDEGLRRAMSDVAGICLDRGGEFTLHGRRIAVTHGDSAGTVRRLAEEAPDYLLFGHSHRACDEHHGPTRWINPGALHRAATWTVAVLDLSTGALQFHPLT